MTKTNCFQLGTIAKLHGFKGEVSLFLDVSEPEKYQALDAFYVEVDNQLVPFIVESIKPKGKQMIAVKLEGVNDEASAKKLLKKAIYLPDRLLEELDDKHFYDHEVIGFDVQDTEAGTLGKLTDVFDTSSTVLLQVMKDEQEILIPMLPDLVQKVDRKAKVLHVDCPEGLLDIYS